MCFFRDLTIKYRQKLKLDRARKERSLDKLSQEVEREGFPRNRFSLECKASKHYKDFVVRSRLKRVPNEAMKCNIPVHEEDVRRFPHWYINFIKPPDRCMLWSGCEIGKAFQVHFHDCLACLPDFVLQEFQSYLADFLRWLQGLGYRV